MQDAVFALFDACNFLWQKNIRKDELSDLINAVNRARTLVEVALPLSELDMKLHLLKHIAEDVHLRGPPFATSAFVYERMWGRIVNKWLQNMAKPSQSIVKNAQLFGMVVSGLDFSIGGEEAMMSGVRFSSDLSVAMQPETYLRHASGPLASEDWAMQHVGHPASIDFSRRWAGRQWEISYLLSSISPEYKAEWETFVRTDYANMLPPAKKQRLDRQWPNFQWIPSDLEAAVLQFRSSGAIYGVSALRNGHHDHGRSYRAITVGSVRFDVDTTSAAGVVGDSCSSKNSFFVALPSLEDDGEADDDIWVGKLRGAYEMFCPSLELEKLDVVDVEWYCANRSAIDPTSGLLLVSKKVVSPPNGRLWLAKHIIPSRVWMSEWPRDETGNTWGLMHRDSKFLDYF